MPFDAEDDFLLLDAGQIDGQTLKFVKERKSPKIIGVWIGGTYFDIDKVSEDIKLRAHALTLKERIDQVGEENKGA